MNQTIAHTNYRRSSLKRKRKVAVLKRRILLSVLAILIITIGVLVGSNLSSTFRNDAADARTSYKYFTSVQVEDGDNLWDIAGRYLSKEYSNRNDYMEELIAVNNLADATIYAGQYLTIPYYSYDYK